MANTLFLRLEGPLQSWGERSRWSVRDTAPVPTKSAVVGLLACALGLRDDEDLRWLSGQLRLGVRCDRAGVVLRDFQTVVDGVIAKQNGEVKIDKRTHRPQAVVIERYYLSDASFLAAVRSHKDLVERLSGALRKPWWPLYLGCRSCVPSLPIFAGAGDYPSLEAALAPPSSPPRRAVIECGPGEGAMRRHEVARRSLRTFGPLYLRDVFLEPAPDKTGATDPP